jgi:hypothetical protein
MKGSSKPDIDHEGPVVCSLKLGKERKKNKKEHITPHGFSVTFFLPFGLRPFFILLKINDITNDS